MILPYLLRLLCLAFASFFLVHATLASCVRLLSSKAVKSAGNMRPRNAAWFLLGFRLLPALLGLFIVLAICVPGYLWLEPEATAEQVSMAFVIAGIFGAAIWMVSLRRVARAVAGSMAFTRRTRGEAESEDHIGHYSRTIVVEGAAPVLALAGVLRPRLVISRGVLEALPDEEMEVALRHEIAHRTSSDNLKRLLLLLAPEPLPGMRMFQALDRAWSRYTEWAADDRAVAGDSQRSLSLASALLRVARMGAAPRTSALMTSLVAGDSDLSARVDRLLLREPPREAPVSRLSVFAGGAGLVVLG
ncbi:MAG: M56 family metallopeptidase, partial [Bryobacteraceae bacterium]